MPSGTRIIPVNGINGSEMYLIEEGDGNDFYYNNEKPGIPQGKSNSLASIETY